MLQYKCLYTYNIYDIKHNICYTSTINLYNFQPTDYTVTGRGRDGHVIFWERPGEFPLSRLSAEGLTIDILLRHWIFCTEYQWNIICNHDQTAKSIAVIDAHNVKITDAAGAKLEYLKRTIHIANQHYPERGYVIYVLNAPYYVSFAYNLIKPWVDPATLRKVRVLRPGETLQGLLEHISIDQIPTYYGGQMQCGGEASSRVSGGGSSGNSSGSSSGSDSSGSSTVVIHHNSSSSSCWRSLSSSKGSDVSSSSSKSSGSAIDSDYNSSSSTKTNSSSISAVAAASTTTATTTTTTTTATAATTTTTTPIQTTGPAGDCCRFNSADERAMREYVLNLNAGEVHTIPERTYSY